MNSKILTFAVACLALLTSVALAGPLTVTLVDGTKVEGYLSPSSISIETDTGTWSVPLACAQSISFIQRERGAATDAQLYFPNGLAVVGTLNSRDAEFLDLRGDSRPFSFRLAETIKNPTLGSYIDESNLRAELRGTLTKDSGASEDIGIAFSMMEMDTAAGIFSFPSFAISEIRKVSGQTVLSTIYGDRLVGSLTPSYIMHYPRGPREDSERLNAYSISRIQTSNRRAQLPSDAYTWKFNTDNQIVAQFDSLDLPLRAEGYSAGTPVKSFAPQRDGNWLVTTSGGQSISGSTESSDVLAWTLMDGQRRAVSWSQLTAIDQAGVGGGFSVGSGGYRVPAASSSVGSVSSGGSIADAFSGPNLSGPLPVLPPPEPEPAVATPTTPSAAGPVPMTDEQLAGLRVYRPGEGYVDVPPASDPAASVDDGSSVADQFGGPDESERSREDRGGAGGDDSIADRFSSPEKDVPDVRDEPKRMNPFDPRNPIYQQQFSEPAFVPQPAAPPPGPPPVLPGSKAFVASGSGSGVPTNASVMDGGMLGFREVPINGGAFKMGRTRGLGVDDEVPAINIRLLGFYMDVSEVSVGAFAMFVKETGHKTAAERDDRPEDWRNPGHRQDDNHPVTWVSWYDAITYCNWRSKKMGLIPAYTMRSNGPVCDRSATGFRLPTEAEWEYAARAGSEAIYPWGDSDDLSTSVKQANFFQQKGIHSDGFIRSTSPSGSFPANSLGLYDLSGNVWEWCQDVYHPDAYFSILADQGVNPVVTPGDARTNKVRCMRGGSFMNGVDFLRLASRGKGPATGAQQFVGFRCVRSAQ